MEGSKPELPATYRCFDCGHVIGGMKAGSASFVGQCPKCPMGMLLVYTLDGEPVNRGYWPEEAPHA